MCWPLRRNHWEVGTITRLGGDEIGHLLVKDEQRRGTNGHLGKASESMAVYHKIGRENRMVKIQSPLLGMGAGGSVGALKGDTF